MPSTGQRTTNTTVVFSGLCRSLKTTFHWQALESRLLCCSDSLGRHRLVICCPLSFCVAGDNFRHVAKCLLDISEDSSSGPYAKIYVWDILLSMGHCDFFFFSLFWQPPSVPFLQFISDTVCYTLQTLGCTYLAHWAILATQHVHHRNASLWPPYSPTCTARRKVGVWSNGKREIPPPSESPSSWNTSFCY